MLLNSKQGTSLVSITILLLSWSRLTFSQPTDTTNTSLITPYKIKVSDTALESLALKLKSTQFPTEIENAGWTYGSPLTDIKNLTQYWLTTYDWRKQEQAINSLLPQFQTTINVEGFEPLSIHFVHQRNENNDSIPLLFLHGWPGSFLEVKKLLPLLKGGRDGEPPFHVVAPSLPNFGFSSRVNKKGFGLGQYAEAVHNLMLKLGYDEYVTHGGDWGSQISRTIGLRYPKHCKASHITLAIANEPKWNDSNPEPVYSERDQYAFAKAASLETIDGSAYFDLLGTKPSTIAFALQDSPVGLLSWIYEKQISWTDNYPWTPDEILTWVSLYYFSVAGPAANFYIYFESRHDPVYNLTALRQYIDVPLGIGIFPKEIAIVPKTWRATLGPVISDVEFDKGGHFAAWERPEDVAGQLRGMFGRNGTAFGVVEGRDGY